MGTIVKPHLFIVYGVLLVNAIGYFVVYLVLKNVDSRDSLHRTIDKLVNKIALIINSIAILISPCNVYF